MSTPDGRHYAIRLKAVILSRLSPDKTMRKDSSVIPKCDTRSHDPISNRVTYKVERHHRYPTLDTANQNSRPPTWDHPNAPRSHSAQARNLICETAVAFDGTAWENAMFSKAMGEGVTSHQFICSGGEGRRSSGAGGLCPAGSS
jgi:hypothetical protein